ncbi:MAG TPA: RsmD family RNA methyltransferase [Caulobacteraceae bacterium]|nr:RsmD family RNA methyltransferase [Caulobacteraceae bacterium]
MRIVAGEHRGRPLVAPKGHSTRPTADRARQALFNVLEHAPWSPDLAGLRVLDLFAGSGALGLEALSRGAAVCLFADTDPAAAAAIAANLAALRLEDRASVRRWDATRLPSRLSSPTGGGGPRRGGGGDAAEASPSPPPSRPSAVLPPEEGENRPFDLAFLDPPYGKDLAEPALAGLLAGGWLTAGALAVVERGAGEPTPAAPEFTVMDSRTWGAARVWFLRAGGA